MTEETTPEQVKVKQPPILFDKTQAIIAKISAQFGWPLIS